MLPWLVTEFAFGADFARSEEAGGHQGLSWGLWQNLREISWWPSSPSRAGRGSRPYGSAAVVHVVPLVSMMFSEVEIMYLPLIRYSPFSSSGLSRQ